jgi:hypothetical protein
MFHNLNSVGNLPQYVYLFSFYITFHKLYSGFVPFLLLPIEHPDHTVRLLTEPSSHNCGASVMPQ